LIPDDEHLSSFQDLASKAQRGAKIPLKDAKALGNKEPFIMLPHTAQLARAVEIFGGGVHRVIVVKPESNEVVGILSQAKLIRFLWENGTSFPVIDQLYPKILKELNVGALNPICIK
jgi:CBS-domain-containing membrane protein